MNQNDAMAPHQAPRSTQSNTGRSRPPVPPLGHRTDAAQLALARGHRWLAMLESGEVRSMKEIARSEGVDDSYVNRMVNLTTLAPDIVVDETLTLEVTLFELATGTALVWEEQRGRAVGNDD